MQTSILSPQLSSRRVLLVDDNSDDRELLTQCLHPRGYRIFFAENGQEGIERAEIITPDIILMDVSMPGISGLVACRLIKASATLRTIPIIFLSAASLPHERVEGLRAGAVDYITKPFDFEEVLLRVAVHIPDRPTLRPEALPQVVANPTPYNDSSFARDAILFRAACAVITNDLSGLLDVNDIAASVGTNARRLNVAFRRCAESTVLDVIREARMVEARRLLSESSLEVAAIACAVGFETPRNFSTAFKQRFGVTPSSLRKYDDAPA